MKKTYFILVLLLLVPVSLRSADFLDTQGDVANMVQNCLGKKTSTTSIADTTITKFAKMAAIDVNNATQALALADTILTTAYQENYTADSMQAIWKIYFISKDTLINLVRVKIKDWDTIYITPEILDPDDDDAEDNIRSLPSHYDMENNRFIVYPIPVRAGDTLIVEGLRKIVNIESDSSFPGQLGLNYRTAIVYRTCYLVARSLKYSPSTIQGWADDYKEAITTIRLSMMAKSYTVDVNEQ